VTERAPATRLLGALRLIAEALDAQRYRWALVGGLAVSIRCEPRFTRDIDLAVAVADDAAAEALVSNLVAGGFQLRLSLEHQALARLAAVRLTPPGEPDEGVVVDLLFSSSGIELDICAEAERLDIEPGLTVPVAQAGHLVAMKVLSLSPDRPQDAVDLHALLASLGDVDRALARRSAARIEAVGANRSKRLSEEVERWLDEKEP
jgi:predicted nucleotidyltransferase